MRTLAAGDVRALKDQPGFRLRVGAWRVIFDITADLVSIRHVIRRSERTYR
jgi:mRNA-degrading endonuclease RelE of RelBE toxin-antitoxin system